VQLSEKAIRPNDPEYKVQRNPRFLGLLIFDEAERLTITALELIRDIFDRRAIGIILIGMPGMEKRMSR